MATKDWKKLDRAFPSWMNKITGEQITILKATGTSVKYIIYTDKGNKFAFSRPQAFKLAREYMEIY